MATADSPAVALHAKRARSDPVPLATTTQAAVAAEREERHRMIAAENAAKLQKWEADWVTRTKPAHHDGIYPVYDTDLFDGARIKLSGAEFHVINSSAGIEVKSCRVDDTRICVAVTSGVIQIGTFGGPRAQKIFDHSTLRQAVLKVVENKLAGTDKMVVVLVPESEEANMFAHDIDHGFADGRQSSKIIDAEYYNRHTSIRERGHHTDEEWAKISDHVTTFPDMMERLGYKFERGVALGGQVNVAQFEFVKA